MKFTLRDIPVFRSAAETPPRPRFPVDESVQDTVKTAEFRSDIPVTQSEKFRELFIPPDFMSKPRPTWQELLTYAKYAPYPGGGETAVRTAGVWYARLVALPAAFLFRLLEWVFERPARLLVTGGLTTWAVLLIHDFLTR